MKTKVIEKHVYYRIGSPRGIMSDVMDENNMKKALDAGYFKVYEYTCPNRLGYVKATKKYKVGKVHKYTRKTTITEEVLD